MSGEISSILSGALMQEARLDVLANNAANVNTIGFKEDKVFRIPDSSRPIWETPDGKPLKGMTLNTEVAIPVASYINMEQGRLIETHNALDVSIDGKGLFVVQAAGKNLYTRKGSFTLNQDGTLVTQDGFPVMGQGGPITINGQEVEITQDGTIIVDGQEMDKLNLVEFPDSVRMLKAGNDCFEPADPNVQPTPAQSASVLQGYVEGSNVDPIRVMTEMIDVLRGYESYQKAMLSMNDIVSKTVNEVGKIS
jgi:flagellar basal-body rod protein FlgG